jgi:hypothetical protein
MTDLWWIDRFDTNNKKAAANSKAATLFGAIFLLI